MSHKLGQVFLHDKNILNKIMHSAAVGPKDSVVEIGCGHGVMTEALAKKAAHLTVIEIDESCILKTQETIGHHNHVAYIHSDVLETKFSKVTFDKFLVVANIPYYISAKILKLLIEERLRLNRAIVMVQKEFAKKLIAKPGDKDYTSLSVHVGFYFDVVELFGVARTCFSPVPDVDSSVIQLLPKSQCLEVEEDAFFAMVRTGFWGRRKPLVSALAKGPYLKLDKGFKQCAFFMNHKDVRGEVLSLDQFYALYQELRPYILDVL